MQTPTTFPQHDTNNNIDYFNSPVISPLNIEKKSLKDISEQREGSIEFTHSSELGILLKSGITVAKKDTTSAIGPLGLLGFGLTTFLLNLHNAEVYPMSPVILGMGACYGGFAQLLAGILEWFKGNNFTAVAFCSYGTFWWSFVLVHAIPIWGWTVHVDDESLAWYLFAWFVFTCIMLVASFTKPWVIRVIFATLALLFLLLAAGHWSKKHRVIKGAGIVGVICAIIAIYAGGAEIINAAWKRTLLPLGAPGEKMCGEIEE